MLGALEAHGFRNLAPLAWTPGRGVHLILGANGAGKTSLLEAVYAIATSRSFRTHRLDDCIGHDAQRFSLRAEIEAPRRVTLGFEVGNGQRLRRVNDKQAPLATYLEALPVIPWTAADGALISGAPEERRRFLDRGVVAERAGTIAVLARHRQALGAKRKLLLDGGAGLAAWNEVVAQAATELTQLRAGYCGRLASALAEVLETADMGLPAVRIAYRPSLQRASEGPAAVLEELETLAPRERRERRVLRGPQRDDLEILWDGHAARKVTSAGERKAIGMALVAAQGHVLRTAGRQPLYLLDDADTELDRSRLAGVFRCFGAIEQMLITSNRPAVFDDVPVDRRWRCQAGQLAADS